MNSLLPELEVELEADADADTTRHLESSVTDHDGAQAWTESNVDEVAVEPSGPGGNQHEEGEDGENVILSPISIDSETPSPSPTDSTATLVETPINRQAHHKEEMDRLARTLTKRVPQLGWLHDLRITVSRVLTLLELRSLMHFRACKGWRHKELDICFAKERRETRSWVGKHRDMFAALERVVQVVPPSGRFEFLDLGYVVHCWQRYEESNIYRGALRADAVLGDTPRTYSERTALLGELVWHYPPHRADLPAS
ncbi:hypothetical protein NM688_g6178 [Phlebia brevispora]|uniref:Uncharacterized protein n=1 Tax=Phlebia brevispora TaxID=194682 RepID=A0ACC1SJ13_9APHY|nr:hypothetical protein NM688_g6178 [Phlebia brevispora]